MKNKVAIIMGSQSDLPKMQDAIDLLKNFKILIHVEVVSAHRTPEEMLVFSKNAKTNGFDVIIAGAGGAAHLPGMVASMTTLPVIGVPINITAFNGLDALLSIVQMPKGVPVATMAVDNSLNAGLFAARILGLSDLKIQDLLINYQHSMKDKVEKMNRNIS